MQPKVWVCSVGLALSWLISPVLAVEAVKLPNRQVQKNTTAKPIVVSKAEFGVFRVEKNGKTTLIPTTKVPLQEGIAYGWRVQLKDYQGEVTWREVLQLPKPPESWATSNTDNFSLSPDGTAANIQRTDSIKDGVITNSWTIATGDPMGKHKIQVYIGDRRIATFEFEVVPAKRQKPAPKA
ncbi:hypothetical protein [Fischerella sp. NIES-3754]|uniref:hypothetical protein n=1 Tax=Fischerella sp. NIES-3754 TaxID=1752063 RepID=UPI000722C334|nr:hypothetical protein [Fischerella sp. NIES-3754]BAU07334.1 hypothetical protein FIS3754_32620 [Fischerella sp. NIES-3754]